MWSFQYYHVSLMSEKCKKFRGVELGVCVCVCVCC